ncbi:MAG TPA: hypothetical protein PLM79_16590 [Syntrophobacteraceae bacterium]|nr:hypothetical protein [Syntrophobacteraceae bacterium]
MEQPRTRSHRKLGNVRDHGGGGKPKGAPFGKHILYSYWKKACSNLGIEGVDLYAGTRHSTMQYMRILGHSPEEVKRLSFHTTNAAMNRYLQINPEELRAGYAQVRKPLLGAVVPIKPNKFGL